MTHDERVYHHMYETNEGIAEHAERIAKLEELCEDMWHATYNWLFAGEVPYDDLKQMANRMHELGIEVDA